MNKENEKLVDEFNRPDSLLVISSYPEKGIKYSDKVCAVGGFAKNTLEALNSYLTSSGKQKKIIVLTLVIGKEEVYKEDGVLIWRVFERDNPLSYLKLLRIIRKFNQIKDVLVEFEFASFGNTKTTAFFPLLLLYLRFLRKNTNLVLHQVILDLRELMGHLGWSKKRLQTSLFNIALKVFFWLLVFLTHKVVVLEETLQRRLIRLTNMGSKIVFIPHGVDRKLKVISRQKAKVTLGIKKDELSLLYFGYLTWYKGVDFLVKTFVKNKIEVGGKPVRLIIAGGESATQKTKSHYQKFIQDVYKMAKKSKRITITGFVKEEDIPLYFSAADLVILPYRTFMSSSGPLSLSFSFRKPFIMSVALSNYFESSDFSSSLREVGLEKEDILFPLRSSPFIKRLKLAFREGKLAKLVKFSEGLARKRDFSVLAPYYAQLLVEDDTIQETSKAAFLALPKVISTR